jgi:hypothetical protein
MKTGSGKAYNSSRERGGPKGFGVTNWQRPAQYKGGKVFKKGQEFRPVYDSGLGKDPIDRSMPQSVAGNTDGE